MECRDTNEHWRLACRSSICIEHNNPVHGIYGRLLVCLVCFGFWVYTTEDLCDTDWEKEASKAATLASKEEEEVLVRQSLDLPRHSMNGAREPLLAGLDRASGQDGQDGLQCPNDGPDEEDSQTCCRGGAAPHSGAASDLKYEVVAECGTAPSKDEA